VEYLKEIKQKYDPLNIFAFPQGLACCEKCSAYESGNAAERGATGEMPAEMFNEETNHRGFRYVKA